MTKVQQYFDSYGYSDKNNILLNVDERFGERRFGVNNMSKLPKIFFEDQFRDWNYKLDNGESQKEVSNRIYSTIMKFLRENKNKRITIVSHATAISYLLKNGVIYKL